jgi:hypothetical protein
VSPLPNVIHILPLFLSETTIRSRVAIPDSAIAVSLVSTLGGSADSERKIITMYQFQKAGKTWTPLCCCCFLKILRILGVNKMSIFNTLWGLTYPFMGSNIPVYGV